MFTITTATGKQFDSDYAVASPYNDGAYVRIINSDMETVERVFSDPSEMPIGMYPQYQTLAGITDESTGIKLVLKP